MTTLLHWISLLGLALATAVTSPAQGEKLTLQARFDPPVARAGETVRLVLQATTEFGWHAYGKLETGNIPVAFDHGKMEFGALKPVGAAQIPDGDPHEVFGVTQYPLPEMFEVVQTLEVPAGQAPGEIAVSGLFDYQVCDENSCDPPTEAKFRASLVIEAGAARAEHAAAAAPAAQEPVHTTKPGLRLDSAKLTVKARFDPATARAGETVKLVLEATTVPGWHAYGHRETMNVPVSLDRAKVQFGGLEPAGEPVVPPGEPHEVFGETQYPLPSEFEVTQAVKVPDGTKPGDVSVQGMFDYQVCDENSCDRPAEAPFAAKLTIEAGPARGETAAEAADDGPLKSTAPKGPFDSWWALILACIGGGLFALAMPCTYPMIPITFSFFTKQAEKRHGSVLPLALTYGFGIIAMFVVVGVALSAVIIPIVNHWLTNLVIGVVFLLFSMVLFGWINLNPPRFLQNAAGQSSQVGGLLGVFFMGATLVIASFTCTAPIVGSLIANVAQYGPMRVGIGMAIFGLTMAIPFVALSLMPGKVKAMPRSGEWMETLKISLGFVELAAVLKFLSVVDLSLGWAFLNRELFLLLTVAILLLWAMFLFGFMRKAGEPVVGVGAGRQATGMFVVLFAAYLLTGAMGHRLDFYTTSFVPPYSAEFVMSHDGGGGETKSKGHTIVYDDRAKAIEVAKAEDKLLLYNFTGFN